MWGGGGGGGDEPNEELKVGIKGWSGVMNCLGKRTY